MSDTKIVPTQYDGFTHNDVERIKVQSEYLRGTIKDGLVDPVTGSICDDDQVLIKFHGIYQQDDRDLRNDRRKSKHRIEHVDSAPGDRKRHSGSCRRASRSGRGSLTNWARTSVSLVVVVRSLRKPIEKCRSWQHGSWLRSNRKKTCRVSASGDFASALNWPEKKKSSRGGFLWILETTW